ncbi:NUDIX domain-containing protein [Paenibacillus sp. GCM10028914]|uniref:NUDIX hydrolase n=1 Tax=Paenibacillus sp. GCM10028914 TaxID=3273416 RepID=UPI003613FBBB
MLKYNLCLIRQGTKILLLNRESLPWMGCWNGVGGKLEENEEPRLSVVREIFEETEIDPPIIQFKGLITWTTVDGKGFGGMYLYLADLPEDYPYKAPRITEEGILDWKEIDWILHPENLGVASNIPSCLEKILNEKECYNHHSIFSGNKMINQTSSVLDARIEEDGALRKAYLSKYVEENCRVIS